MITPLDVLLQTVKDYREHNSEPVVWTNGCFDMFHRGHLNSLHRCHLLGAILVVGINSNKSIQCGKGKFRPIIPEKDREAIVNACRWVDMTIIFDDPTPCAIIAELKPDIFVKGMDWKGKEFPEREIVQSYGGRICFVDSGSDVTTTGIIERIYDWETDRRNAEACKINQASIKAFQENRQLL